METKFEVTTLRRQKARDRTRCVGPSRPLQRHFCQLSLGLDCRMREGCRSSYTSRVNKCNNGSCSALVNALAPIEDGGGSSGGSGGINLATS